ncbi:cytochrome P450 [Streptomyces mashuensis]|uniref:Cytochrome P450 n=1 Tax=Streptomyces mashuensis TaxID=33904 RepID=A0A919EE28_9ACTN|nr:cytochrome P450 [Streptomyces mashuensis]GHF53219.1 cytochrome P450 [Streptomyces mashuensis]
MTTEAEAVTRSGGREIPVADGALPLIGHAIPFFRDPVGFLLRAHEKWGEAVVFLLPGRRLASFCGPRGNAAVLDLEDDTEADRRQVFDPLLTPLLGPGVSFNVPTDVMTWQHSLLLPHLRRDAFARHLPLMSGQVEQYIAGWGERGTFDVVTAMRDLAPRITAHCLIGPRFGRTMGPSLPRLLRRLDAGLFLPAVTGPRMRLHHRWTGRTREELARAIKEIAPDDRPEGSDHSPFGELLRAVGPGGRSLNEDTAAHLVITWLFSGVSTSVHAAWTGVLLLQHPQWLPVLRAEQETVLGDQPPTTLSSLRKLERLGHCVLEAERLHPAIPVLPRTAVRDLCINGYRVPRGQLVCATPGPSHRLPGVFRDPEKFDPDRYLPGREENRATPHALIGFGGGRHPCLGSTFAQLEIKIIWSVLLRAFDLELVRPEVREARTSTMRPPRRPCTVRYRRRKR